MQIRGGHQLKVITDQLIYVEEGSAEKISFDPDRFIQTLCRFQTPNQRKIICRDRFGFYDEIELRNGNFFRFVRIHSSDKIIKKIKSILNLKAP